MTDDNPYAMQFDWKVLSDWGVPVLDLFLHAVGECESRMDEGVAEHIAKRVEFLADVWLKHNPARKRPDYVNAPGAASFTTGVALGPGADFTGSIHPGPTVPVHTEPPLPEGRPLNLVPACGHVSDPGVDGKRHTCFLPQSHEQAGIAHEDDTMKWFRAAPKPFKKSAG